MSTPVSSSDIGNIGSSPLDPPSCAPLGSRRTWKHIVRDPVALVLIGPAVITTLFWIFILGAVVVNGAWLHGHEAPPGTYEFEHPSIDPKSFGPLYIIVGFSLFAAPVLILVGAGMSMISVFNRGLRRSRTAHIAFLVGSALYVVTVVGDMGGCIDWFID